MIGDVSRAENCDGFGCGAVELTFGIGDDLVERSVWFELKATIAGRGSDEDGKRGCVCDGDAGGICCRSAAFELELEDGGEVHAGAGFIGTGNGLFTVRMACTGDVGCGFAGELEAIVG